MAQLMKRAQNTGADNTTAAEVTGLKGSSTNFSITVECVDANGAASTPAAGTVALTVQVSGALGYETAYDSDGTTAISIDLTSAGANGAPVTKKLVGYPIDAVKATPSSLSAGSLVKLTVNYE